MEKKKRIVIALGGNALGNTLLIPGSKGRKFDEKLAFRRIFETWDPPKT